MPVLRACQMQCPYLSCVTRGKGRMAAACLRSRLQQQFYLCPRSTARQSTRTCIYHASQARHYAFMDYSGNNTHLHDQQGGAQGHWQFRQPQSPCSYAGTQGRSGSRSAHDRTRWHPPAIAPHFSRPASHVLHRLAGHSHIQEEEHTWLLQVAQIL